MTADLHLHSYYSDGAWSPQELVDEAVRLGFSCMALTDHDSCAGLAECRIHAAGRIDFINGIELNTVWKSPDGKNQDVHILGYFIDPENPQLIAAMEKQQIARRSHALETVERLRAHGYAVEMTDVEAAAGKGSIGRPHICAAMLQAGVSSDMQVLYRMLMDSDSPLRVERFSITPQEAIAAISAAGGLSSLAHPGKSPHIEFLLEELLGSGLNALEVFHRGHSGSLVKKYLKLAARHNMLITGGSDCHGRFKDYPVSIGSVRLPVDILNKLQEAAGKHAGEKPAQTLRY